MNKRIASGLLFLCACGGAQSPSKASEDAPATPVASSVASSDQDEGLLDFDPASLVHFTLVADTPDVKAGTNLTLGAQFEIAEGWHIYWTNPGDSGLPTKIRLDATGGLTVAEPIFPGPVRFDSAGDIVNYGYRGLLLVPIQATVGTSAASVTVHASASWLACREDACVPGKGTSSLTLGQGMDPARLQPEALAATVAALPKPLEAVEALGGVLAIIPGYGETEVRLELPPGYTVELFPEVENLVRDASQSSDERGVHLRWVLTTPQEKTQAAVLSVRDQRVTHFFSITSAHLQALKQ